MIKVYDYTCWKQFISRFYLHQCWCCNKSWTLLGFGTWTAFGTGRTIVGVDSSDTDFDAVRETGGSKTHTLTIAELPAHTHQLGL